MDSLGGTSRRREPKSPNAAHTMRGQWCFKYLTHLSLSVALTYLLKSCLFFFKPTALITSARLCIPQKIPPTKLVNFTFQISYDVVSHPGFAFGNTETEISSSHSRAFPCSTQPFRVRSTSSTSRIFQAFFWGVHQQWPENYEEYMQLSKI